MADSSTGVACQPVSATATGSVNAPLPESGAPPPRGTGHGHRASELDSIADVRMLQPPEQRSFVAPRRAHIESQVHALESELAAHPPNSGRWKPISDAVFGGIDRVGMAAAYGVLWLRGYRSRQWANLPVGTLHALHGVCPHAPLPPLAICSGLGSSSTDYVALLLRLWGIFRSVTVIELPGHGYSATTSCPLTAAAVRDAYRLVLDELSASEPIIVVGHSLGGRVALDYVTGCGRNGSGSGSNRGGDCGCSTILTSTAGGSATAAPTAAHVQPSQAAAISPQERAGTDVTTASNAASTGLAQAANLDALATEAAASLAGAGSLPAAASSHHDGPGAAGPAPNTQASYTSEAVAAEMQRRVAALVLVAAMGAPFAPADLQRLFSVYSVEHYSQGESESSTSMWFHLRVVVPLATPNRIVSARRSSIMTLPSSCFMSPTLDCPCAAAALIARGAGDLAYSDPVMSGAT